MRSRAVHRKANLKHPRRVLSFFMRQRVRKTGEGFQLEALCDIKPCNSAALFAHGFALLTRNGSIHERRRRWSVRTNPGR